MNSFVLIQILLSIFGANKNFKNILFLDCERLSGKIYFFMNLIFIKLLSFSS